MREFLLLVLLGAGSLLYAQEPAIIPKPVSTSWLEGNFSLNKNTVLVTEGIDNNSTDFFNSYLQEIYGFRLKVVHAGGGQANAGGAAIQ